MDKKIFEFEGHKIGFKFSMLAKSITEEETGMSFGKLLQTMVDIEEVDGKKIFKDTPHTTKNILYFLYGGACAYADSKGVKRPTVDQVADLVDDIGFDRAMEVYREAMKTYLPKNVQTPEETPGIGQ